MNFNTSNSAKQYAPATQRNREPILTVLKEILPSPGNILEIASGTGEHAVFFAPHFPKSQWIPSDIQPDSLLSIAAWRKDCPSDNLQPPLTLDVSQFNWERLLIKSQITTIICINMIHISPWSSCIGLMTGAGNLLTENGILYLYGPYKVNNQHIAPSNQEFDQYLQAQNPEWGVRNLEDVVEMANQFGFQLDKTVTMPANNLSVIFRKQASLSV
jgi:hypothetical protein